MSRKVGLSRIKLQSYVVLPENINDILSKTSIDAKISLLGVKEVTIKTGNKDLTFDFDQCFSLEKGPSLSDADTPVERDSVIPSGLINCLDNAVDLVLMGYCSTILSYCSQPSIPITCQTTDCLVESDSLTGLVDKISAQLFKKVNERDSSSSLVSDCEYRIEFSCFELVDSQFRDFLSENVETASLIKLRENPHEALCVDGICRRQITDQAHLMHILRDALQSRLLMLLGNNSEGKSLPNRKLTVQELTGLQGNMIGYFGNIIVQLTVNMCQTIQIPSATSSSTVATHRIHRKATLNIVSLNTADALITMMENQSFKCFTELNSYREGTYNWLFPTSTSAASSSVVKSTGSASEGFQFRQNQLKNSLKSLSTLTRVVASLIERNKSDSSATDKNQQTSVHVPFRDSVLTRLLKNVLSGNCFLSMITIPPSNNVDGISRALRFASQIGKLFNMIWVNEEVLLKQQLMQVRESGLSSDIIATSLEKAEREMEKEPNAASESYQQFSNLQNEISNQMNLLANELDQLELWRLSALEKLSLQLLPVRETSEKQHQSTVAYLQHLSKENLSDDIVNSTEEIAEEIRDSMLKETGKAFNGDIDSGEAINESEVMSDKPFAQIPLSESPSRKLTNNQVGGSNKIILKSLQQTSNMTSSAALSVKPLAHQTSRNTSTSGGNRRPSVTDGNDVSSSKTRKRSMDTSDRTVNTSARSMVSSLRPSTSTIRKKSSTVPLLLNTSPKTGNHSTDLCAVHNGFKGSPLTKVLPRTKSIDQPCSLLGKDDFSSIDGATAEDFRILNSLSDSMLKDSLSQDENSEVVCNSGYLIEDEESRLGATSAIVAPRDKSLHNSSTKLHSILQSGSSSTILPSLMKSPGKDTIFQSSDAFKRNSFGNLSNDSSVSRLSRTERVDDCRIDTDREESKLSSSPNESIRSSFVENCSKPHRPISDEEDVRENYEMENLNTNNDDSDIESYSNRHPPKLKLQLSLSKNNSTSLPAILKVSKKMAEKEEEMLDGLFKKKKSYSKYEVDNREEEDEDDDGLNDLERNFLRAVSTGIISKIQSCLQKGVNIHVKNSFER
jgi:hypothetical protein